MESLSDLLGHFGADSLGDNPAPEALRAVLAGLAEWMRNGADPVDVALAREELIGRLKAAGVNSPARLVDAALTRDTEDGPRQGQALALTDPEPWPGPVDGAELLADLVRTWARFVVSPRGGATAVGLWIAHTYAVAAAYTSPYLALISPAKRCGKTRGLEVLHLLVYRPLAGSKVSPAAVYRTIDKDAPTFLIDEADKLGDSPELHKVLNAGVRRLTAYIVVTVGDEHEPRRFSAFGPKALALIGKLPDTLADRAIVLPMSRKKPGQAVEPFREDRLAADLEPLRRKLARWAADNLDALRDADPEVPEELNDRAADNWRPLLAIADLAGGDWPERARKAAVLLSALADDDSAGVQLLADLRAIFKEAKAAEHLPTKDILAALHEMEGRPWPEWRRGNPLTATGLAKLLKPFKVRPKTIRAGESISKGYVLEDFADAFSRYLPCTAVTPLQVNGGAGSERFQAVTSDTDVTAVNPRNPLPRLDCNGVTARKGGLAGDTPLEGDSGQEADTQGGRQAERRVPSRSRDGLTHTVRRGADGTLKCGCESRVTCWHIKETCPGCMGGKPTDQPLCSTCEAWGR